MQKAKRIKRSISLKTLPDDIQDEIIFSLTNYVIERIFHVTLVDFTVNELSTAYVTCMELIGLVQNDVELHHKSFDIYRAMLKTIYHCMTIYWNCHKKRFPIRKVLTPAQLTELKTLTLVNNRLGWMPKGTFFNVVTQNIVKQYLHKTKAHYKVGLQAAIHFLKPILKAMYTDYDLKKEYALDTDLVFELPQDNQHLVSALWETVKMKE